MAFFPIQHRGQTIAVWAAEGEAPPEKLQLRYKCKATDAWQPAHKGIIAFSAAKDKDLSYLQAAQVPVARAAWAKAVEYGQLGSLDYQALRALYQDSLAPTLFVYLIADNLPLALYMGMAYSFASPGPECDYALFEPMAANPLVQAKGFTPKVRLTSGKVQAGSERNQVQWKVAMDSLIPPVLLQYEASLLGKSPKPLFEKIGCQGEERQRACYHNVEPQLFPKGLARVRLQARLFGYYPMDSLDISGFTGFDPASILAPDLQADTAGFGEIVWKLNHMFGDSLPVDTTQLMLYADMDTVLFTMSKPALLAKGTWTVPDSLQDRMLYMAVRCVGPWGEVTSNSQMLTLPKDYEEAGETSWLPASSWDLSSSRRDLLLDVKQAPPGQGNKRFLLIGDTLRVPYQEKSRSYGGPVRVAVPPDSFAGSLRFCEQMGRQRQCSMLEWERPSFASFADRGKMGTCVKRCDWLWNGADSLGQWADSLWIQPGSDSTRRVAAAYKKGMLRALRTGTQADSLRVGVRLWNGQSQEVRREEMPEVRSQADLRCPAQTLVWVMDSLGDGLTVQASWQGEPLDSARRWTLNFYQGSRVGAAWTRDWTKGRPEVWSDTARWTRGWFVRGDTIDAFGVATVFESGQWKTGESCNARVYVPRDTLPRPRLENVAQKGKTLQLHVAFAEGWQAESDSAVVRVIDKQGQNLDTVTKIGADLQVPASWKPGAYGVQVAVRHRYSRKLFWSPVLAVYLK